MTDASQSGGARRTAWAVLVVVLGGVIAAAILARPAAAPRDGGSAADPAVLFAAPRFALTRESGGPFGSADLAGRVWIADFIFTSCAGPCPVMTRSMADLARTFAGETHVRFVSFSVDPSHDTPAVLREYAARFDADPKRWCFLTGDEKTLYALALDGFHVLARRATSQERRQPGTQEILHSPYFFLVDHKGCVRGTYDGTDPQRTAQLIADTKRLLRAGE